MNKPGSGRRASGLSVYSNLSAKRRQRADARARQKAEHLASLPKNPVKRFFYRLHPKRFFAYWFSRQGAIMALKLAGVAILLLAVGIGALFAYYRRELDAIQPGELAKRVQTTVTRYYDRNGVLLWEDKGDGNYKLVVDSKDINNYMKEATVSIEDKDFYHHGGISVTGIARAAINDVTGGDTQGASTLTQQLIKLVFFQQDADKRGINGIPRKIKEAILAIEVERMYDKDQILSLYLNEAPYGGPRNGVESASQQYFGKAAKDLTLPEAALLAAIPQQPTAFNPYNVEGNKALIDRQHTVLDKMAQQGYITQQQADDAKKVAVLDTIKPEFTNTENIKAPHFVLAVRAELEQEFGQAFVRSGGLTIKTTLDYRMQQLAESAVTNIFTNTNYPKTYGFDNAAFTAVDVPTGQIVAEVGSRDYDYPGYGSYDAARSFLQPGSSIKPLVYAALFKQKPGTNYGAGSVLSDEPLPQSVYKTDDGQSVQDFDFKFLGNIPIRQALARSRNIPAIKAMAITGIQPTLDAIHDAGDVSYCTDGQDKQVGLGAAIGGCGLKQTEHVNAIATLARMGVYKPVADVLEVQNAQGQVIKQWKDQGKQVLDPQIPYIINDILSDDNARAGTFGSHAKGMYIPGVKTATKTGTTNLGNHAKDSWMISWSPKLAAGIWLGNHDATPVKLALSTAPGTVIDDFMRPAHLDILQKDGTWKPNDWFTKPAGVQTLNPEGFSDLFPSWYSKPKADTSKVTFDKVSKKKATTCTPDAAKIDLDVQNYTDPVTKQSKQISPDGYDVTQDDDVHNCSDVKPFASVSATPTGVKGQYKITATVNQGTHALQTLVINAEGKDISSQSISSPGDYSVMYTFSTAGTQQITATVTDNALYTATVTNSVAVLLSALPPQNDRRAFGQVGTYWASQQHWLSLVG